MASCGNGCGGATGTAADHQHLVFAQHGQAARILSNGARRFDGPDTRQQLTDLPGTYVVCTTRLARQTHAFQFADPPRLLGATGLAVSPIGLGLAALGRPGYLNLGHGADLGGATAVEALEARARDVLDAAWRGGVRYFDAARSYGRAEEFLGRWLADRGIEPSGVAVGSKWGYVYTAGWRVDVETHEVKDHALDTLRQQWSESRRSWVATSTSTRRTR